MRKFLLAILVDNKPGVLTHVAGLISRRAFNIESINAGYTEEESVTRINIVVSVDSEWELEQVKHQLSKLIDVVKIVNLTEVDNITRELVLIKVRATAEARADLINIVNIFTNTIFNRHNSVFNFFSTVFHESANHIFNLFFIYLCFLFLNHINFF